MAHKLILIRHGVTEENSRHRFVGSQNVPLSSQGRQQAQTLVERMKRVVPFRCYCSPLQRARETAEIALNGISVSIETLPGLREVGFGRWEGKTFAEIQAADPELVNLWAVFSQDFQFPEGEKIADFLDRTSRVASHLATDPADVVVAFAHGGVIRALICHLLGLPARCYGMFEIKHVSWTILNFYDGKATLAGLNDLSHLHQHDADTRRSVTHA